MRVITLLRRLLGVTQLHVEQVRIGTTGMLHVSTRPSWRRSRCGRCGRRAVRYDRQPARLWRHLPWGRVNGVAAVCAVAGVVLTLRGSGRAGVVGGARQRVHGAARGTGGVSGAGDGPDDGESPGGHFVAGGRRHHRAGGGSPAGLDAAGRAAAARGRQMLSDQ